VHGTMTAKEMFEKKRFYERKPQPHLLTYEHPNGFRICFNLSTKVYYAEMFNEKASGILIEEHAIITQQMKELGWIE